VFKFSNILSRCSPCGYNLTAGDRSTVETTCFPLLDEKWQELLGAAFGVNTHRTYSSAQNKCPTFARLTTSYTRMALLALLQS